MVTDQTTRRAKLCQHTVDPQKEHAEGRRVCDGPQRTMSGGVLLSHAVSHAVPSALKGLTSGFGMGPGVSPSLWPPKLYGDVPSRQDLGKAQKPPRPTAPREPHSGRKHRFLQPFGLPERAECRSQATRPISTGQLHTLPCFHL